MASDIRAPTSKYGKPREKVALKPGFHLMDWHRLMQASTNFDCRDGGPPRRISLEELKSHKSEFDCWTAYNGKVYNITQYMQYHPGGVKQLMAGAGKDCTKAFNKFHAWVNIDNILAKCYIGPLMEATNAVVEGDEENMDSDDEDAAALAREREKLHQKVKTDEKAKAASVFKLPASVLAKEQLQPQARAALDEDTDPDADSNMDYKDAKDFKSSGDDLNKNDLRVEKVTETADAKENAGGSDAVAAEKEESDAEFIARREQEDAEAFRLAVDDWRSEKAAGRGEADIKEVGGAFAAERGDSGLGGRGEDSKEL